MNNHPLLNSWLRSSTCFTPRCKRSVLFENETYIVLKHGSHAMYQDRIAGVVNCQVYAELYKKADLEPGTKADHYNQNLAYGRGGEVMRWEGRINKDKILEDCKSLGILFENSSDNKGHVVV